MLKIHKDFYGKRSNGLASDSIDEEFMTYPTAIVCFEDSDFKQFFAAKNDEAFLNVDLEHKKGVYGYVARLKYSRAISDTRTTFFSKPIVFKVRNVNQLAPFDVISISPTATKFEQAIFTITKEAMEVSESAVIQPIESAQTPNSHNSCYSLVLRGAEDGYKVKLITGSSEFELQGAM